MGKVYVCNTFSLSMLSKESMIEVKEMDWKTWVGELQFYISNGIYFINAIGHKATDELFLSLLEGYHFPGCEGKRIQINVKNGDEIYVIQPSFRLEEGRVLNKEEIEKLFKEGRIRFFKVIVRDRKIEIVKDYFKKLGIILGEWITITDEEAEEIIEYLEGRRKWMPNIPLLYCMSQSLFM